MPAKLLLAPGSLFPRVLACGHCSGSKLINMTKNAPIRRAREDKRCHRLCQSKNPKVTHSLFLPREFSGDNVLFVVGSNMKTKTAATEMIEVRQIKETWKVSLP